MDTYLIKIDDRYFVDINEEEIGRERMNAGGTGTRSFVYEKLSEALEGTK